MEKRETIGVKEVAQWLGVSEETVRRMTNRGELLATKVGWQWRYQPADIQAYLDRNKGPGQGKTEALACAKA